MGHKRNHGSGKGKGQSNGGKGKGQPNGKLAKAMRDGMVLKCWWACNIDGSPKADESNSWRPNSEVVGHGNGHDVELTGAAGVARSRGWCCEAPS